MKIINSVVSNIEKFSGFTVTVKKAFLINATPYKNKIGYTVYPVKSISGILIVLSDDTGERSRIIRQVAFDEKGNHYRFIGSCEHGPIFELAAKDKYDGFTALETIELIRLRDAIIAR